MLGLSFFLSFFFVLVFSFHFFSLLSLLSISRSAMVLVLAIHTVGAVTAKVRSSRRRSNSSCCEKRAKRKKRKRGNVFCSPSMAPRTEKKKLNLDLDLDLLSLSFSLLLHHQVPFAMISLLDLVRHKSPPFNLKCRMLLPSSGSRSASLWDVDSAAALQAWLDDSADADCTHEVVEIQEDFALGIAEPLARARAGEKVAAGAARAAAATTGAAKDLDAKYKVTAGARAAAGAVKGLGAKALEDERVAAAASAVGGGLSKGWRWAKGAAVTATGKITQQVGGGGGGGGSGSGGSGGNSFNNDPPPPPYGDVAGSMPPPGGAR